MYSSFSTSSSLFLIYRAVPAAPAIPITNTGSARCHMRSSIFPMAVRSS